MSETFGLDRLPDLIEQAAKAAEATTQAWWASQQRAQKGGRGTAVRRPGQTRRQAPPMVSARPLASFRPLFETARPMSVSRPLVVSQPLMASEPLLENQAGDGDLADRARAIFEQAFNTELRALMARAFARG